MSIKDTVRQDMKKVHLAYFPGEEEADAAVSALAKEGIRAEKGTGIRDPYAVGKPMGIEIFVSQQDASRAAEIVRSISSPGSSPASGKQNGSGKNALSWTAAAAALVVVMFLIRLLVLRQ